MHTVDLHLDPNEASDLCPVFAPDVLEGRGWDRAFLTVLDEASVEDALALIVHDREAELGDGWQALRVNAKQLSKGRAEDSEACASHGGHVYVLGSQFGKKTGPLEARRSWMARVAEDDLAAALDGGKVPLELARLRFALHRAVNDALEAAAIDLLELGPLTREAYIDATIRHGAAEDKAWSGRVLSGDHPINVEGCAFRPDGRLLLGLRYPVTAEGHPIVVELADPAAVFEDPGSPLRCSHVWTLEGAGDADAPVGIRALHEGGTDTFHAVVGDLDATDKGPVILEDHPEGGRALSRHVRFELPALAAGGPVQAEPVRDFEDEKRIEGLAVADGHAFYVIDRDGHVGLRAWPPAADDELLTV